MADSINSKAKEYYDNDDTGGSLNSNLKDFLVQQGATGKSINTLWRDYAYGEGGTSLNTRLRNLWGTSGSLMKRWKDTLGLTWDELKAFFNFRDIEPDFLLDGSTSFDGSNDYISIADADNLSFGDSSTDSAFSISAWIKMDDATNFPIVAKGVFNTNGEYYLSTLSDDKLYFFLLDESGSSTREYIHTSPTLTTYENQWVHITATYDGRGGTEANAGQKVYINGSVASILKNGGGSYVAMENLTSDVYIGRYDSNYADGSIANVGIWNRELSASEVESIYWRGSYSELKGTELTNLVSWYDLNSTSFGSDLITNGDDWTGASSSTKPTGWSGSGGGSPTHTIVDLSSVNNFDSSTLRFTADGVRNIFQNVVLDGARYKVEFAYRTDSSSNYIYVGNSLNTIALSNTGLSGDATVVSQEITSNGGGVGIQIITGGSTIEISYLRVYPVSAPDSEGTNDGTIVGATTNSDSYSGESPFKPRIQDKSNHMNFGEVYSGRALDFDGSNDLVVVPDSSELSFGDGNDDSPQSISVWVNMDDASNFVILNKGIYHTGEYNFHISNDDFLFFDHYDEAGGGTGYSSVKVTNAVTSYEGQWTHICATYNGAGGGSASAGKKIYINGVSQSLTNADGGSYDSMANKTDDIEIGRYSNSPYANGKMASLKMFSAELTQAQVQELYTKPETVLPTGVSASNLKLDLPMQEGSGSYIYDGSGNQNHGTITGASWVTGEEYGYQSSLVRSNTPMVFDGSDDAVTVNGFRMSGNQATFSFWANVNSASGHLLDTTAPANNRLIIGFNDQKISVYHSEGGTGWKNFGLITNGVWNHIAIVINNTTASAYVNGSQLGNNETITAIDLSGSTQTTIGANAFESGGYIDGIISEFAVWDTNLDADAVSALYNSGVPLLPTSDSGNYDNSDSLVGYWRNDGNTTWTDRSTNSNDGTASGSPVEILIPEGSTEGRDSQGYYLSDTTSISNGIRLHGTEYIEVKNSQVLNVTTSATWELWMNQNAIDTSAGVIGKGSSTGSMIAFYTHSSGKFFFDIRDGNTQYAEFDYSTAFSSNTWHHLVVVYDGTLTGNSNRLKVYVDSNAITLTFVGTIPSTLPTNTDSYFIGETAPAVTIPPFNGLIDEVRIYDKALLSSEIIKNYNSGKSAHQ